MEGGVDEPMADEDDDADDVIVVGVYLVQLL